MRDKCETINEQNQRNPNNVNEQIWENEREKCETINEQNQRNPKQHRNLYLIVKRTSIGKRPMRTMTAVKPTRT